MAVLKEELEHLNIAQQSTLFYMAVLSENASELLNSFSDAERDIYSAPLQALLSLNDDARTSFALSQLKHLQSQESQTYLYGIHPSWIVADLKREEPLIVASVLSILPSALVKRILKRLDEDLRSSLPDRSLLKEIDEHLVQHLGVTFIARFPKHSPRAKFKTLTMSTISHLPAQTMQMLLMKSGVHERTEALLGLGKRALAAFLKKCEDTYVEQMITYARQAALRPSEYFRAAGSSAHLLIQEGMHGDESFLHAGLVRLARLTRDSPGLQQTCQYAMPRAWGLAFNRLCADTGLSFPNADSNGSLAEHASGDPLQVEQRQLFLNALVTLSEQGKASPRWSRATIRVDS